jgi:hypothetical protein
VRRIDPPIGARRVPSTAWNFRRLGPLKLDNEARFSMARRYCDEPEHINPYRSNPYRSADAPDVHIPAIAICGALVLSLLAAAYALY